jgi:hypothetical protein
MTGRELLDAIRSGLEETSRRFANGRYGKGQIEQMPPSATVRGGTSSGDESSPRQKAIDKAKA